MIKRNFTKIARFCLFFSFIYVSTSRAQSNDQVSATPQRPSFSTSASTTHPGWLELEAGVSIDNQLFDSPLLLKIGVLKNTELFVGLSPIKNISNGSSGFGDVAFGGRLRFKEAQTGPSLAGQFSIKLPAADSDKALGSGEIDYSFLLILSHAVGDFGLDLNSGVTFAGMPGGGTDEQFSGIVTLSRPFTNKLSGFGEIFLTRSFESDDTIWIGAAGASLTLTPRFILDTAINFNLSNAAFDVQLVAGATVAFAQIW